MLKYTLDREPRQNRSELKLAINFTLLRVVDIVQCYVLVIITTNTIIFYFVIHLPSPHLQNVVPFKNIYIQISYYINNEFFINK